MPTATRSTVLKVPLASRYKSSRTGTARCRLGWQGVLLIKEDTWLLRMAVNQTRAQIMLHSKWWLLRMLRTIILEVVSMPTIGITCLDTANINCRWRRRRTQKMIIWCHMHSCWNKSVSIRETHRRRLLITSRIRTSRICSQRTYPLKIWSTRYNSLRVKFWGRS